jgi:hypothetical protein
MASEQKTRANRENARASTGPKTACGRARSSRNALRHGLSVPVCALPAFSEEAQQLAADIAGAVATGEVKECARRVAEAQIDLDRVRDARRQLFEAPKYRQPNGTEPAAPHDELRETLDAKSQGLEKFMSILSEKAGQLLALDQYERRALSRRKFAIRAFDEVIVKVVK